MIKIEIPGSPTPWAAPRVCKSGSAYSPKGGIKVANRIIVKSQYREKPLKGPIIIECYFYMPIPASLSKKRKSALLNKPHICKPDTTNLQKFAEDCLSEIVYEDDAQVFQIFSKKIYSENPKTVIDIFKL
jgi:Holliday junction resolvase RusA-like endonuclease